MAVLFIFDLASVAQPRPAAPSAVVELVSAAPPPSSTPARPRHSPGPHRAPHPVSAAAPDPTLRRRRFPRAHPPSNSSAALVSMAFDASMNYPMLVLSSNISVTNAA